MREDPLPEYVQKNRRLWNDDEARYRIPRAWPRDYPSEQVFKVKKRTPAP
jgi:hypothetical protein